MSLKGYIIETSTWEQYQSFDDFKNEFIETIYLIEGIIKEGNSVYSDAYFYDHSLTSNITLKDYVDYNGIPSDRTDESRKIRIGLSKILDPDDLFACDCTILDEAGSKIDVLSAIGLATLNTLNLVYLGPLDSYKPEITVVFKGVLVKKDYVKCRQTFLKLKAYQLELGLLEYFLKFPGVLALQSVCLHDYELLSIASKQKIINKLSGEIFHLISGNVIIQSVKFLTKGYPAGTFEWKISLESNNEYRVYMRRGNKNIWVLCDWRKDQQRISVTKKEKIKMLSSKCF